MPVSERGTLPFYVLIGLLQGGLILLALLLDTPVPALVGAALGVNLQLLGGWPRDRVLWLGMTWLAMVLAVITAWVTSIDSPGWSSDNWAVSMVILGYIVTAFIVSGTARQGGRVPYTALFQHGWNNAFIIALALLLTLLFWLLLVLCAKLFQMLGIRAFDWLVDNRYFLALSLPVVGSLGMRMGCQNERVIGLLRGILLSLCRFLAPLAALIVVLFTLALPFTGLEPVWKTGYATRILVGLAVVMLYLVNGVYQDGQQLRPYNRPLLWLLDAALCCLPVLAALAAWSVWLRIDQYGLTPARCTGLLAALVMAVHGLALLCAVLRRGGPWLASLRVSNPIIALQLCAVLVAINTPWLNFEQLSARNQVQRLLDGRTPPETFDASVLYWDLGASGRRALDQLLEQVDSLEQFSVATRQGLRARLQATRDNGSWAQPEPAAPANLIWLTGKVRDAEQFSDPELQGTDCNRQACYLWAVDLDGDGQDEVLSFSSGWPQIQLFHHEDGHWRKVGYMEGSIVPEKLAEQIRAGKATIRAPRWRSVEIDGQVFIPVEIDWGGK